MELSLKIDSQELILSLIGKNLKEKSGLVYCHGCFKPQLCSTLIENCVGLYQGFCLIVRSSVLKSARLGTVIASYSIE